MKSNVSRRNPQTGEARIWRTLLLAVSYIAVVGMTSIPGFGLLEAATREPVSAPAIAIQIYNYSKASPTILTAAEHEADKILGKAGLRVMWLECPLQLTANAPVLCNKLDESDIAVRVLSGRSRDPLQSAAFGLAFPPSLANVYYDRANDLARGQYVPLELPLILGCIIAHEIGHLLLGPNGHFTNGIMQRRWGPNQIRLAVTRRLFFTDEQSKIMRANAYSRMRLQANLGEQRVRTGDQPDGK